MKSPIVRCIENYKNREEFKQKIVYCHDDFENDITRECLLRYGYLSTVEKDLIKTSAFSNHIAGYHILYMSGMAGKSEHFKKEMETSIDVELREVVHDSPENYTETDLLIKKNS